MGTGKFKVIQRMRKWHSRKALGSRVKEQDDMEAKIRSIGWR